MEECEYCGKETKSLAGLKSHYRFCKVAQESLGEEPAESVEIGDPTGFQVSKVEKPKADKDYLDTVLPEVFKEVKDSHARRAIVQERPTLAGLSPQKVKERLLSRSEITKLPYAVKAINEIIV